MDLNNHYDKSILQANPSTAKNNQINEKQDELKLNKEISG